MVKRFLNISLQGLTLGLRFLFIFLLAKYLEPSDVGLYGLFAATVGYALYFVGLDFYVYLTREILKNPIETRGRCLKSQAVLALYAYAIFIPVFYVLLKTFSNWPNYLIFLFFPILILEHFNQEASRLLVALSKQVTASVVLFIRQGCWALITIFSMIYEPTMRELLVAMLAWMITGIAAASIAVYVIYKMNMGGWSLRLDWSWVKKGILVCSAFLVATLALRGFQTFDRYWLSDLAGIEVVGAYVLFAGVAGTLLTFLDAGVFSFAYPTLIQFYQQKDYARASKKVRMMFTVTILLSLLFAVFSWVALPYLLNWIGRVEYINLIEYYPYLLAAMIINAIGMVPHYALYAAGKDMPIIYSHIFGFFVFFIAAWLFSFEFGPVAVPLGLLASFLVILIWKSWAYVRLSQSQTMS